VKLASNSKEQLVLSPIYFGQPHKTFATNPSRPQHQIVRCFVYSHGGIKIGNQPINDKIPRQNNTIKMTLKNQDNAVI